MGQSKKKHLVPEAAPGKAQTAPTAAPIGETIAPEAEPVPVVEAKAPEAVPREEGVVPEEEARSEEPIPPEEAAQANRVLAAIQRHSEGVSIVDIGNELGVDWRSLIATLQSLEAERKIERINTVYYPGEKAREGEL